MLLRSCTIAALTIAMNAFAAQGPATTRAASTRAVTTRPSTTQAATRPATRPAATRKAEDPLRAAVVELTKEAQEALRKKQEFPRGEPDYFTGKSVTIDQETLLKALAKQIVRDPRIDAYVKLQLLSAVPTFDEAHAKSAIQAYVLGSPPLIPLPGMTTKEQQVWDRKAQMAKPEDVDEITEEYQASREPVEAQNAIILRYRDAMRDHITAGEALKGKLLQARIEELSQRAAAGFDTTKQLTALSTEIKKWAALARKTEVADMTAFVKDYARRTGPTVYTKLSWNKQSKKARWTDREAALDAKKLEALIEALKDAETNAL